MAAGGFSLRAMGISSTALRRAGKNIIFPVTSAAEFMRARKLISPLIAQVVGLNLRQRMAGKSTVLRTVGKLIISETIGRKVTRLLKDERRSGKNGQR